MPKDDAIDPPARRRLFRRRRPAESVDFAGAAEAFRQEDVRALKAAFYMRLGSLLLVAMWLSFLVNFPAVLFFLALLLLFVAVGYAEYRAGAAGKTKLLYALILFDFLLLAFSTLTDNPIDNADFPPGQKVQQGREAYFYILLAGVAACYQPRRVLWAGASAMTAWTLGFLWLTTDPRARTVLDSGQAPNLESWITMTADPYFVDFNRLFETLVVMLIVTGILAAVAYRARKLVRAQIASTRERSNLARYFAPTMVETLAAHDAPFDKVNAQSAAVLFADVVGFTSMFQNLPPQDAIDFLRALHERLEQAIFDNGGTLDKYMGDGVMAIFGTPEAGPDDACRAIAAARAIQDAVGAWNKQRAGAGLPTVRLSVGVHFGPVVSGDIGSARRLEFATIGDAVNVASRLEAATRKLDAGVVISAATADRARDEDANRAPMLLAGFADARQLEIPGHAPIDALALKRTG